MKTTVNRNNSQLPDVRATPPSIAILGESGINHIAQLMLLHGIVGVSIGVNQIGSQVVNICSLEEAAFPVTHRVQQVRKHVGDMLGELLAMYGYLKVHLELTPEEYEGLATYHSTIDDGAEGREVVKTPPTDDA